MVRSYRFCRIPLVILLLVAPIFIFLVVVVLAIAPVAFFVSTIVPFMLFISDALITILLVFGKFTLYRLFLMILVLCPLILVPASGPILVISVGRSLVVKGILVFSPRDTPVLVHVS